MDVKLTLLHWLIPGLFTHQQKSASYLFLPAKLIIAQVWKKPTISFEGVKDRIDYP